MLTKKRKQCSEFFKENLTYLPEDKLGQMIMIISKYRRLSSQLCINILYLFCFYYLLIKKNTSRLFLYNVEYKISEYVTAQPHLPTAWLVSYPIGQNALKHTSSLYIPLSTLLKMIMNNKISYSRGGTNLPFQECFNLHVLVQFI